MLLNSGGKEGDSLWVAKVLLLFRMSIKGDGKSREKAFLQYIKVKRSIETVDATLGCVCSG